MLSTREERLDNGLRVVVVHTPHLHSASFCLAVGCGSRHDPWAHPGLSHLLEHMLFRGSRGLADTLAVSHAFEAAGGALDAATWRDHLELSATVHPERLGDALAHLADVAGWPRLAAKDLVLERGIVLEELRAELDEKGRDSCVTNRSRGRIWADHPLGRPILGTRASLEGIARGALVDHHRRLFVAGNMALCVATPGAPGEVIAAARRALGTLPRGPAAADGPPPPALARSAVDLARSPGSQCTLQLTFRAPADRGRALVPAAQVLGVLDDGFATRLPEALVHNRGWVYDMESGLDSYRDGGLLDITLQLEAERVAEAAQVVAETVRALACEGPREGELAALHRRLVDGARFQLDDTLGLACRAAVLALFDEPLDLDAELAAAIGCPAAAIQAAARHMFVDGPLHLTVMGPVRREARPSLERLLGPARRAA